MPKIEVQRSIKINAPSEVVFPALNNFHKWIEWSPWLLMEPDAKVKVADDEQSYEWEGDRLGSGNMRFKTIKENEFIDFDLNFIKPWKSSNTTSFHLNSVEGGTEVTWTMNSSLPFFMFWMKKMMMAFIGSDYERGLSMLKAYVEEGEVHSKLEFLGESNFSSTKWVGINSGCSLEDMPVKMESDFSKLHSFTEENKDLIGGSPFTSYHKWDLVRKQVNYTACIPVKSLPASLPSGFSTGTIPDVKVNKLKHIGAYKHLGNAWSTVQAMIRNKEFKPNKKLSPFEVYHNDPKTTPENELITEIHFPLK